jgi:ubiquinone/menaquinone biosynthesis C-methylase UbiE
LSGRARLLATLLRSWLARPARNTAREQGQQRLHLGCGGDIRPGWINLDTRRLPGVDVVADLDACRRKQLPFPADSIDEFLGSHILEHLNDPLAFMQELHRIAKPASRLVFRVPYGSSDDADQDPTHVRRYFMRSFYYFSQLGYTHFDYGYSGDWDTDSIVLTVDAARHKGKSFDQLLEEVRSQRNVVLEMIATLAAVKPARKPGSMQPKPMRLEFQHVDIDPSKALL